MSIAVRTKEGKKYFWYGPRPERLKLQFEGDIPFGVISKKIHPLDDILDEFKNKKASDLVVDTRTFRLVEFRAGEDSVRPLHIFFEYHETPFCSGQDYVCNCELQPELVP